VGTHCSVTRPSINHFNLEGMALDTCTFCAMWLDADVMLSDSCGLLLMLGSLDLWNPAQLRRATNNMFVAFLRAKRKYFQRLFKTWWKKLNIYCTTFDYNVWMLHHSILKYRRSLCMFLFILSPFLTFLLSPFLSMYIQFYFVCLEIKLLWLYVIRPNKMYIIYYYLCISQKRFFFLTN
jgi:hypothetical protein